MTLPKLKPPVEAPSGLSERAQELWHAAVPRFAAGNLKQAAVTEALRALDRADEARAILDSDGLTLTTATTKAVHRNPVAKIERECRAQFVKLWPDLGLTHRQEPYHYS